MKFLDNSTKHIEPMIEKLVFEKIGKKVKRVKFIGGGSYGRIYKTELSDGEIIAVKAYKLQGMQHNEAEQLRKLADNTKVEMPEVIFTYEDDRTALLAMSFIKGQNVLNPIFLLKSRKQKQCFAEEVISGMLEWHSVTGKKFGSLSAPAYDSWYDYYKQELQLPWIKALTELSDKGKFSRKKLVLLNDATKIFNALPEETSTPVLIHADLNIMNIMADTRTFKLTGFIDPCGCMWADREYDLFQLRNMWGDAYGLYETYKQKYPLSKYADFRVAYYGAMLEASMRLKGGHTVPLWEDINFRRLKKEMKKINNI